MSRVNIPLDCESNFYDSHIAYGASKYVHVLFPFRRVTTARSVNRSRTLDDEPYCIRFLILHQYRYNLILCVSCYDNKAMGNVGIFGAPKITLTAPDLVYQSDHARNSLGAVENPDRDTTPKLYD